MGFLSFFTTGFTKYKIAIILIFSSIIAILILLKFWKSDIQHKTRLEIGKELSDQRIDNLNKGKKVDEKIFTLDDIGLCAAIGGCKLPDNKTSDRTSN